MKIRKAQGSKAESEAFWQDVTSGITWHTGAGLDGIHDFLDFMLQATQNDRQFQVAFERNLVLYQLRRRPELKDKYPAAYQQLRPILTGSIK
ncbi:MAG: hypothetical protein V1837_06690 [Candidatus Woesearchaeota archaeon]